MINFQQVLRRIEGSDEFKNFKKEFEDSFICSAFFVVDFESQSETKQLDYYIPSKEEIASFLLDIDSRIKLSIDDIFQKDNRILKKISTEFKIGFEDAVDIAKEHLDIENIKQEKETGTKGNEEINKVIAVMQKINESQIWNLTCMIGGTNMFLIHIDSDTGKILKKEKVNIMNFIRRGK